MSGTIERLGEICENARILLADRVEQPARPARLRRDAGEGRKKCRHRSTDGFLGSTAIKTERRRNLGDDVRRKGIHNKRNEVYGHGLPPQLALPPHSISYSKTWSVARPSDHQSLGLPKLKSGTLAFWNILPDVATNRCAM